MAQSVPADRSRGKFRIRLVRANSWRQLSVTAVTATATTAGIVARATTSDKGVAAVVSIEPVHPLLTSLRKHRSP